MKTIKNATTQPRTIFLPSGRLRIEPGQLVKITTAQAEELQKFFKSQVGKALVDGKFLLIDSKADIQTTQPPPTPPSDLNPVVAKGSVEASANTETRIDSDAEQKIKLDGKVEIEPAASTAKK